MTGLSDSACSGICEKGYYCPAGSTSARQLPCGSNNVYCPSGSNSPRVVTLGYYSVGGDNRTRSAEIACERGHYCVKGERYACPPGTYGATEKLFNDVSPIMSIFDSTCSGSIIKVRK